MRNLVQKSNLRRKLRQLNEKEAWFLRQAFSLLLTTQLILIWILFDQ